MAELDFDLEYDGPALQQHEMDVRQLAPALISTADLFQELNRQLFPTDPPLSVNVRATSEGSFLVQLRLVVDDTINTLSSSQANAIVNLVQLVSVTGGLITYLIRRHRSQPVAEEPVPDQPGLITVTFADGTTLEIDRRVLDASRNAIVQRGLFELSRPLRNEGIDVVRIIRESATVAEITVADVEAFPPAGAAPDREILNQGERVTYLTIHTVGFATNRWRFFDGISPFWAPILDDAFIAELDSGRRRIGKLDVVHCRIHEQQWRDSTGFHSEVEVLDVLDVVPYEPVIQQRIFDVPPAGAPPGDPPA